MIIPLVTFEIQATFLSGDGVLGVPKRSLSGIANWSNAMGLIIITY